MGQGTYNRTVLNETNVGSHLLPEESKRIPNNNSLWRYTKADSKHDLDSREWVTTSLDVEDTNVRLYGNTAVVTSRAIRKGEYKGQDDTGEFR